MENRREVARAAIHGDLVEEILLRMPCKSIAPLKIVCKEWGSLISSHKFALRRNPCPNPAVGLFLCKWESMSNCVVEYLSFEGERSSAAPRVDNLGYSNNVPGKFKILQSCNGFLLCRRWIWPRTLPGNEAFFVYNPTTTQHLELPVAYRPLRGFHHMGNHLALAFDPEESHHYKVICVHSYRLELKIVDRPWSYLLIQVYSSETGYWRDSGGLIEYGWREFIPRSVVFWNRSIIWIPQLLRGTTLYFNIDEERVGVLRATPLPLLRCCIPRRFKMLEYAGESRGHFNIIERYDHDIKFYVFELENHYSEWFIKYIIDFTWIAANFNGHIFCDVHALIWGKTDDDSFFIVGIRGKSIRFNIGSGHFDVIRELGVGRNIECYQYFESLCCV